MWEIYLSRRRKIPFGRCIAQHGAVETLSLITDRETGSPRGFGFVEMPNARAMQALNGPDFDGRPLRINEVQSKNRTQGAACGRQRRY